MAGLIAALLVRRFPPAGRVLLVGDRDPSLAEALLKAGYSVARADIGPWLRPSVGLEGHGQWLGDVSNVTEGHYSVVVSIGLIECLQQDEIASFLETIRNAAHPDGHIVIGVPNNERLEQDEIACPKTGIIFHSGQRLRSFDRASLRTLLESADLQTEAELEVELEERALVEHAEKDPEFALATHAFVGAGTTLMTIARPARAGRRSKAGLGKANNWLQARREAAHVATPIAERWIWDESNVSTFWSRVAGTALDDLSFGKVLGQTLLRGIEPWLVPGGRHLDVGAGEGHMAEILAASSYAIATLEPAKGRAAKIEAGLAGFSAFLGQFDRAADTQGGFDVIIACEVIEHVLDENLAEFFSSLAGMLKPGGRIILSTPNFEDLSRAIVYSPFGNVFFHRWQHVRRFSAFDLEALLRQHGFETDVLHEVDLASTERGRSQEFEEILGSPRSHRQSGARNLIAIAHRAGDSVAPPRPLSNFERRIASPAQPVGAEDRSVQLSGKRFYETVEIVAAGAVPVDLSSFKVQLPPRFAVGDDEGSPDRSMLRLFEDGKELGPAHVAHADVARLGKGRFSHWQRDLF
ncbi:class I SAM-dependent methyltransferase, partial [Bradyrhizobium elkanii]